MKLLLPAFDEARRGSIYTQVQGTMNKYATRKVNRVGHERKGKGYVHGLAGDIGSRNRCSNCRKIQ